MSLRIRRLRISLAAKCRILFGAAVALSISAALYVPWQRMEQLTEQLDRSAASALADLAVQEHLQSMTRAVPATSATTGPTTRPAAAAESGKPADDPPLRKLILLDRDDPADWTRFESRSAGHFRKHPDSPWQFSYYTRPNGAEGYRFAQPLFMTPTCARCHQSDSGSAPATQPALSSREPLLGIASVDMVSRIDANQLLLNRVFIFTAGLLAGTLAVIAFYLITTRLILQPVRVLQETADKVSKGDLNIRSDISTGDEFQQLSETFNVMLGNLKSNQDQLRSINKSLDLRLGELAQSNVTLYESNRLKSEFLANVSHELRTPLNSILGFADLLKDAIAGADGKTGRYVNNIVQSGKHLLDLINDLLDLAKIEAGRMEVRSEPLSPSDLFEGLANILKPLLEQKRLRLAIEVSSGVPILLSDPAKLQQVLYNFLSNAIKFSPAGQQIELTADREGEQHVRIAVTDHGPGIAPDYQSVIFEKFRQVDAGVTRTHGGTGLGLAISKELISLLGGDIGVESALGGGSTFWIRLPLAIEAGSHDVRGRVSFT